LKNTKERRASAFLPSFSKKDEHSVAEKSSEILDKKSISSAYDAFERQSGSHSHSRSITPSRPRVTDNSISSTPKGEESEFASDNRRFRRRKSLGPDESASHEEIKSNGNLNKSKEQPSDEALEFVSSNFIIFL
jgi:hypothetical protein